MPRHPDVVHGLPSVVYRQTVGRDRQSWGEQNHASRNEGHGHRVTIDGPVRWLAGPIIHDDRKPLSRWFLSQKQYAGIEADHLLASPASSLHRADRVRLMAWPAPILVFFYALLVKGCILDGWAGWLYVLQRTLAELMIAIEIVNRRLAVS